MKVSTLHSDVVTTVEKPLHQRWEDLLPARRGTGFDDAYAQLSPDQVADLALLGRMAWLLKAGKADAEGGMARDASQIRQAFAPPF